MGLTHIEICVFKHFQTQHILSFPQSMQKHLINLGVFRHSMTEVSSKSVYTFMDDAKSLACSHQKKSHWQVFLQIAGGHHTRCPMVYYNWGFPM